GSVYTVTLNNVAGNGTLGVNLSYNGTIRDLASNLLANFGAAQFAAARSFGVGASAWDVRAADLNNDGKPDLVVANLADATVGVLLGNGDGTFKPQVTYTVGGSPKDVAIGDVNGDGKLDVMSADNVASGASV